MTKAVRYFSKLPMEFIKQEKDGANLVLREMLQDSDRYVPHDTGKTRVESSINERQRYVEWANEYVEFIFWGITMNFQQTNNQEAQALWTDTATKRHGKKWEEIYADSILKTF